MAAAAVAAAVVFVYSRSALIASIVYRDNRSSNSSSDQRNQLVSQTHISDTMKQEMNLL